MERGARPPVEVREAVPSDATFLAEMLAEAVDWRPDVVRRSVPEVLALPEFARYVVGWPRRGDAGVVGGAAGTPLGAAWYRFLPASEPGYGFVDDSVPEVTIGVVAARRGHGIGTALLSALLDRAHDAGVAALSLSVEEANPAQRLYARLGFTAVDREHGAMTMVWRDPLE